MKAYTDEINEANVAKHSSVCGRKHLYSIVFALLEVASQGLHLLLLIKFLIRYPSSSLRVFTGHLSFVGNCVDDNGFTKEQIEQIQVI